MNYLNFSIFFAFQNYLIIRYSINNWFPFRDLLSYHTINILIDLFGVYNCGRECGDSVIPRWRKMNKNEKKKRIIQIKPLNKLIFFIIIINKEINTFYGEKNNRLKLLIISPRHITHIMNELYWYNYYIIMI